MIGLTHQQRRLLDFIQAEAREGRVPTFREMQAATGCRLQPLHKMVKALKERGHITSDYRRPRSLRALIETNGHRYTFQPARHAA